MPDDDAASAATLAASPPPVAPAERTVADTLAPVTTELAVPRPASDAPHFIRGKELARGGMGRIVLAEDTKLSRTVALKLLQSQNPMLRVRFDREAQITAKLAHPAIVPIYEAGVLDHGEPFYAMKLVEGTPLDQTITNATTLSDRLGLLASALAVCEALAYAHSKRIIHRDLKPANVLVGKFGETVVIDWGLAKDLDGDPEIREPSHVALIGDAELTVEGSVMGTPSYMPPEQARGDLVDERADVYALGALLYHVIAGRPPYRGSNAGEVLAAVEAGPPPAIGELEHDVPDDLASIIAKAMARDPADRYADAGGVADELKRFMDGRLVASHRYSGVELVRRWLRRHRASVTVAAAALIVLAAVAIVSVRKIVAREHDTARALAASRIEQGRQLLLDGDPDQARPYLAAGLRVLPEDPVARRLAGLAMLDAKRAIAAYDGIVAVFRPDGRELAIAKAKGEIEIRDPSTGERLRGFAVPGEIAALDYAAGGLLAVATDGGLELIDAGSGVRKRERPGATTFVKLLGDRAVIATPASIELVGLADLATLASDPAAHGAHQLVVSADGSLIAGLADGGAVLWRVSDLSRVVAVPDDEPRYAVAIDHGDLITAGRDGVRRWSVTSHGDLLSATQTSAVISYDDHTLLAEDAAIRTDVPSLTRFAGDPVTAVAKVGATAMLAGGYDRRLRLWDLSRSARPLASFDAATPTVWIAVGGDAAVTRGKAPHDRLELWSLARPGLPTHTVTLGAPIQFVLADHHERLAVHLKDGPTELVSSTLEIVGRVQGWPVAFRPHGDELVTDTDGALAIYSAKTGAHLRDIVEPDKLWRAAFSPDGKVAVTASQHVAALRGADWATTATYRSERDITALAVDDRGRIALGHGDGTIEIADVASGKLLTTIAAHSTEVSDIELRDDQLITSGWDLSIRAWSWPSGAARPVVKHYDRAMSAAVVAPGLGLVASVEGTGFASLWDGAHGRLLAELPAQDHLGAVAFTDAEHLVVGGDGGHLELVDLAVRVPTADELVAASRWLLVDGRTRER